jgi:hypothetical protein
LFCFSRIDGDEVQERQGKRGLKKNSKIFRKIVKTLDKYRGGGAIIDM